MTLRRLFPLALLALSCSSQPTVLAVRNLERPSDMGWVCMMSEDTKDTKIGSARPMTNCHPHLLPDTETIPDGRPGTTTTRPFATFGLVTNTARGELAVVDFEVNQLVDLDPAQPGYNMLPLGKFPESLSISQDGCRAVTANRGSCDLSLVDTTRLLAGSLGQKQPPSTGTGAVVKTIEVKAAGKPLLAAPQEIVFLPQETAVLRATAGEESSRCSADELAYAGPGKDRHPWRALVTFPGCDLVALIDLPSGEIVDSVYVRPEGTVRAGTTPVCQPECDEAANDGGATSTTDAGPAPMPDASGSEDDGGLALDPDAAAAASDASNSDAAPVTPAAPLSVPLRVGAMAIRPEGDRVYVGAANAPFVTMLDLGPVDAPALRIPADGGRVILHEGPIGVSRLRLSVDPFLVHDVAADPALTGSVAKRIQGTFLNDSKQPGVKHEFLYAFTRDDSVRVVNVDRAAGREHECDVNVDPLAVAQSPTTWPNTACFTIDGPVPPPARRASAIGPGLRIPSLLSPNQPPAPRDISFARVSNGTTNLDGVYGYLLGSNNIVYVVNLTPRSITYGPLTIEVPAHSIRNANLDPTTGRGPPWVNAEPGRNLTVSDVSLPVRVANGGARLENVPTKETSENWQAALANGAEVNTWVRFPDRSMVTPQSWYVVWEGVLPAIDRAFGSVRGPRADAPAGRLEDPGAEFCQGEVLPKDIVFLSGCTVDSQCLPLGEAVCRQADPQAPGLCFPKVMAQDTALITKCSRQLTSRRRYEITKAESTGLSLKLKIDENARLLIGQDGALPASGDRCAQDSDCSGAPYNTAFPGFRCLQVRAGEGKRCVKPCGATDPASNQMVADDRLCRLGTVCENVEGTLENVGPLCVEGPPLDPACFPNKPVYRVQVGQSFLVSGSAAAPPKTVKQLPTGECVVDPTRHRLRVDRIPLDAPHCTNIPDGAPKELAPRSEPMGPPGTWGNPCLFVAPNADEASGENHVKALFQNDQVRFVLTNLEQYVGDANATRFDVSGGFVPEVALLSPDVLITIGARVLTGPQETPQSPQRQVGSNNTAPYYPYVYVIDQGRTSSSAAGRGQVLRLNPRTDPDTYELPRFDSAYTKYPFQIQ